MNIAKFSVDERVKIVRLLDNATSRDLIGKIGTIEEINQLPNGEFNYCVDGHYVHEEELERVDNEEAPVERITNPKEVRKYITVRPEYKEYEEEIINIIAKSGALFKGHFVLGPDVED